MEIKFNKVDLYKCLSEALEKHNLKLREKLKDNPKYFVDYCLEGLTTKKQDGTRKDLQTLKNDIKRVVRDALKEYITDTELYTVEQYQKEVSNLLNDLTKDENTLINYIRKLNVSYLAKNLAPDITISPEELLFLVDKKQIDITNPDIFAVLSRIAEVIEQQRSKYEKRPNSPILSLAQEVLLHHDQQKIIKSTLSGKRLNNRNVTIKMEEIKTQKGKGYRYIQESNGTESIIELHNPPKLFGGGQQKIFCFLLSKMNEQFFSHEIKFNLNEIVDVGINTNLNNARRDVKKYINNLKSVRISGTITRGKKKIEQDEEDGVLIYHHRIKDNVVTVYMNDQINVKLLASYLALIPKWTYELNSKSYTLADYIFTLARQRAEEIKSNGFYKLKLQTIREKLVLPYPDEYENKKEVFRFKQFVQDKILKAIEEVNELAELRKADTVDIKIKLIEDKSKKGEEWLDNSYIEVYLNGEIKNYLIGLTEQKEQKIKEVKNYQRRKRIATAQATEPETK